MAALKSSHNNWQMGSNTAVLALVLLCAALAQADHWQPYMTVDSNQAASTYDLHFSFYFSFIFFFLKISPVSAAIALLWILFPSRKMPSPTWAEPLRAFLDSTCFAIIDCFPFRCCSVLGFYVN